MKIVWVVLLIVVLVVLLAAIDELVTRGNRKRWLNRNRPDLVADARTKETESKFIDVIEGFQNEL